MYTMAMTGLTIFLAVAVLVAIWLTRGFANMFLWNGTHYDPYNVLTTLISTLLHIAAGVIGLVIWELHFIFFFVAALMVLPFLTVIALIGLELHYVTDHIHYMRIAHR